MYDLIFRHATVIDGTGAPRRTGDLGVRGERIDAIGDLSARSGGQEIDASGLVLAPGFIDAHCHDDLAVIHRPLMEPKVSQGVTTVVNGNCGISVAPVPTPRPPAIPPLAGFDRLGFMASYGEYFAAVEAATPAVNSLCLVGHSTLRHAVMDDLARSASDREIEAMCSLLRRAMIDGAAGLSTGIYYPTAEHATTAEVIAVTAVLAEFGGLYATHMRDEYDGVAASLRETFAIGRETGAPVLVSHHKCMGVANHGRSTETLAMIDHARQGQTVWLDAYPYAASSTILQPKRAAACPRVVITWSQARPDAAGRDLSDLAAEMGLDLEAAAQALLPAGAIYFEMDEADVRRILAYEHTMIGSDGLIGEAHPHPRTWGTFPRVLGHYARDEGLFSLEDAVRKMTGLPAARFRLQDRGVLRPGAFADLTLFDPATVTDVADFRDPQRPAAGIEGVWVAGRPIWRDGAPTGERPGRVLRRAGA